MPRCNCCKQRIPVSDTGIRVYTCQTCKKPTCKEHFEFRRQICFKCANIPIGGGKHGFSFIRIDQNLGKNQRA